MMHARYDGPHHRHADVGSGRVWSSIRNSSPPGFDKRELPAQAEPLSAHLYAAALVHNPATVDGRVPLAWTWDRTIVSG